MSELAVCSHLRVVYRTEQFEADVEATETVPGGRHLLTRGWWECDYGCGTKFYPVAPDSRLPDRNAHHSVVQSVSNGEDRK